MAKEWQFTPTTIQEMEHGKSVLMTFGRRGRSMKRGIAVTGFICRLLLLAVFNPIFLLRARANPGQWRRRKRWAIRFLRIFFPFDVRGHAIAPSPDNQIIIISHPSLNDPLCAILYALSIYPEREIIAPVNIPWFESISRFRPKLLKIGVNLVPILTPETAKRLDSDSHVTTVQAALIRNYTAEFSNTLANGGLAVVAPQATRRRFIFTDRAQAETGEGVLSTVSLILVGLRRAKLMDRTSFIPVGVVPHKFKSSPKLHLLRRYTLNVGEPITAEALSKVKNAARRSADLYMMLRLKALMPEEYHFEQK